MVHYNIVKGVEQSPNKVDNATGVVPKIEGKVEEPKKK